MESPKNSLQNCFFIFSDILKNTLQKNCKKRTKKCIFFLLRPFLNNFFGGLVVEKSKFGKNNFFVKKILFLFVFKFFFYVDPGPSIDLKSSYGKITWEKKRYTPLNEQVEASLQTRLQPKFVSLDYEAASINAVKHVKHSDDNVSQ